jgi:hypothetical protein
VVWFGECGLENVEVFYVLLKAYFNCYCNVQDMTSVLLLALETAASPSEAVEALLTVQAMLIGDSTAQVTILRNLGLVL